MIVRDATFKLLFQKIIMMNPTVITLPQQNQSFTLNSLVFPQGSAMPGIAICVTSSPIREKASYPDLLYVSPHGPGPANWQYPHPLDTQKLGNHTIYVSCFINDVLLSKTPISYTVCLA